VTDIDAISRIQYEHGIDPIEWAATLIAFDLEARGLVACGLIKRGVALTLMDQSDEAYARRIVAKLLNAGWTPPRLAEQTEEAS
jgi:hypothetical protein